MSLTSRSCTPGTVPLSPPPRCDTLSDSHETPVFSIHTLVRTVFNDCPGVTSQRLNISKEKKRRTAHLAITMLLVFLIISLLSLSLAAAAAAALQTGPHAGSIDVGQTLFFDDGYLWLVATSNGDSLGTTTIIPHNATRCLVASWKPSDALNLQYVTSMGHAVTEINDDDDSNTRADGCTSLVRFGNEWWTGGWAGIGSGGLLKPNLNALVPPVEYGTLINVMQDTQGLVLQQASYVHPVKVLTRDEYLYILSSTSQDAKRTELSLQRTTRDNIVRQTRYGNDVPVQPVDLLWHHIIQQNDELLPVLVVAGNTEGNGAFFGHSLVYNQDEVGGDKSNMDGFITLVDPNNLTPLSTPRRIASLQGGIDRITALCTNDKAIFVTGTTTGAFAMPKENEEVGNTNAFLLKLDGKSLETIWATQLFVEDTIPHACVTHQEAVYWTGEYTHNNDAFVGKIDVETGVTIWTRYLGTTTGSVVLQRLSATSSSILAAGYTTGSLYRQRGIDETGNDLVLVEITTDGTIQGGSNTVPNGQSAPGLEDPENIPVEEPAEEPVQEPTDDAVATPVPVQEQSVIPPIVPPFEPGQDRAPFPIPPPVQAPIETIPQPNDGDPSAGSLLFVTVCLMVAVGSSMVCYLRQRGQDNSTNRQKVLDYISKFDVHQVDLKHSATGGWHCSYAGDLARGEFQEEMGYRDDSGYRDYGDDILDSRYTDALSQVPDEPLEQNVDSLLTGMNSPDVDEPRSSRSWGRGIV